MSFDFTSFHSKAKDTVTHVAGEFNQLRTGRASVQLLDPVKVEAYGTYMKIGEVATVAAPDANMITVTPWDKSLLKDIERGINEAGLNLNPVVEGTMIRIVVPPLTQERREAMVKLLGQKLNDGQVMLRNLRIDTKKDIEAQKGQPGISEDNIAYDLQQLDQHLKTYNDQLEEMAAKKTVELKTI